MPAQVTFRIRTEEFDRALEQYMEYTRRALPDVLNKKGLYIARGALRLTPSTSAGAIKSSLGQIIRRKSGNEIKSVSAGTVYPGTKNSEAPLAALIINARRKRSGDPGLYGYDMYQAIEQLIAARNRSRSFLKSGWIPAIRALQPLVKDSYGFEGANGRAVQVGSAKGSATPARPGLQCKVIIENAASGPHETHEALIKYGEPALQQAFENEAASMLRFVADKQFEEAKRVGIKVFVS